MSTENAEIVRACTEDFGRLTPEEIPEWVEEFWDREADFYPVRKFPESHPCHGQDEITAFMAGFSAAYEPFALEVKNLFSVGDDRVLAHVILSAEGRTSGVRLAGDIYICCWLRTGKIFRREDHLTVAGALQAFGLNGASLEAAGLRRNAVPRDTSGE